MADDSTNNEFARVQKPRKDRGRLHAVRQSPLSRSLLEVLVRRGESARALRKMERELRSVLQPSGPLARLIFDRFWASVLRLMLVGRLEGQAFMSGKGASKSSVPMPVLYERELPTLLVSADEKNMANGVDSEAVAPDVFARLALMARYDRSASREMCRMLGLLLLMRGGGDAALETWAQVAVGGARDNTDRRNP